MPRFARIIGTVLPVMLAGAAWAEDVVIRIEAKRGAEPAQATAETWGQRFSDVVTFPLSDGWIGIALGPIPREEAAARMEELKAARQIPGDSFIASAEGRELTRIGAGAQSGSDGAAEPASPGSASLFNREPVPLIPPQGQPAAQADEPATAEPEIAEPEPAPAAPGYFIRIESSADRARAEEQLTARREILPDAGLWLLPNGRFGVAVGPLPEDAATQWLAAFRAGNAVPRDAFVTTGAEMGEVVVAGETPEAGTLTTPDSQPLPAPALEDIQRALRWAGHYDGAIDGKDGPMTRQAIAREVVLLRASPDEATAMHELVRRREAWRQDVGLVELRDDHTGLALPAPMQILQFDRTERALSIYAPKNDSGAALILISQEGGQQELLDLTGLVTALGWVPSPERRIAQGSAILSGRNDTHIGYAETRVVDGRVQGFVLIWPVSDEQNQPRVAAEMSDAITRFAPGENEVLITPAATDARSAEETGQEPTEAPAGQETSR